MWQSPAPPCFRDDRSGSEALSALSRAGGLGARVRDAASSWALGLVRWEPEVGSWTLRSGVKSGVEQAQDLHMGRGWNGRGGLELRGLGVGGSCLG